MNHLSFPKFLQLSEAAVWLAPIQSFISHLSCLFRVAGCGLRVTGYELRVAGYGLRVTGYGLRVAGYELRVTGGIGARLRKQCHPERKRRIFSEKIPHKLGMTNTSYRVSRINYLFFLLVSRISHQLSFRSTRISYLVSRINYLFVLLVSRISYQLSFRSTRISYLASIIFSFYSYLVTRITIHSSRDIAYISFRFRTDMDHFFLPWRL